MTCILKFSGQPVWMSVLIVKCLKKKHRVMDGNWDRKVDRYSYKASLVKY